MKGVRRTKNVHSIQPLEVETGLSSEEGGLETGVMSHSPNSGAQWDRFALAQSHVYVQHLSLWRTVIERSFSHMKGRLVALHEPKSGKIVGAIPLYEVRSWALGSRLVSTHMQR